MNTESKIKEQLHAVYDVLDEKKAEDISILDIGELSTIADYFVIATGQNANHLNALIEAVDEVYGKNGWEIRQIEGKGKSGWVLIDCREDLIGRIEEMIVGELQTGGWHRIPTEHRFLRNELLERTIRLKKDGSFRDHAVQIKHFIGGDSRPEYESVQALRKCIREEYGQEISYGTLYNYACAAAVQEEPVVLDLDG